MSLFRKPKKIQRRVFSSCLDEEDEDSGSSRRLSEQRMHLDDEENQPDEIQPPPPPKISADRKSDKRSGSSHKESKKSKSLESAGSGSGGGGGKALLSFADEEDDSEVFQVRKSSHSKKVMRMMDKERRKKQKEERQSHFTSSSSASSSSAAYKDGNGSAHRSSSSSNKYNSEGLGSSDSRTRRAPSSSSSHEDGFRSNDNGEKYKSKKSDSIQTEIRTDDFVLVVKKSEPQLILNGRAALCAGRNDMSDEDEDGDDNHRNGSHRFSKPEQLKQMLESGSIPDAAMIHAARKRRQKAREQGDYVPVEEPPEPQKKGSRLAREDVEGDNSDDEERVDMNGITGIKEREERREQFYAVENDSTDGDSEREMHEWENQQIRKGVTGAQLVNAHHETVLSRFMIKSSNPSNALEYIQEPQSTSTLLEQAYAQNALEKPQKVLAGSKAKKDKAKSASLRMPKDIRESIHQRLTQLQELKNQHSSDIDRISKELNVLKLEQMDCSQKAPAAAAKYRFYQEVKGYVSDLIECLNEKISLIVDLEKRALQHISKHQIYIIERRRQDVRDQAKEMAEASKPSSSKRGPEHEEQIRRAAEREGRRTRRRCEREKNNLIATHLDGMSSDEEVSDRYQEQLLTGKEQLIKEAEEVFSDVTDEYCSPDLILMKFSAWRKTDMNSYKDAFVSLCLPKILGPIIRLEILNWSPILEDYIDIEKMKWYRIAMLYAYSEDETEETLKEDPDVNLVPNIIRKIILPKITDHVKYCWDPLSTTQTLRLVSFIRRLGRDYPLQSTCKNLQQLFSAILEKIKLAMDNDVFIPIFPKQVQEAKTSFFQRQFCSGLKLFRNILSWQGIIADKPLRGLAIGLLLNRYLLMAMRVCSANDAIGKAYIVVNTLPSVWLQPASETLKAMEVFISFIKQTLENVDVTNPFTIQTADKAKQILQRLHST